MHIRLLSVSKENRGKGKRYDRITGNLITHAAKIAVASYAEFACVSLRPKRQLVKHYISSYNMVPTGVTLSIEVPEILSLINGMTMSSKKDKNQDQLEDPEYGVDSRYRSVKEREIEAIALMEARLKRMKNLSRDQVVRARLLQLKLKMEDFVKHPADAGERPFSGFLRSYIDAIYSKRNVFADDIDITPVKLSQILNNHREPTDEFIMKLMIHSEKMYSGVCVFHKTTWYEVYYRERINTTMLRQKEWKPELEKHVKLSEPIEDYRH